MRKTAIAIVSFIVASLSFTVSHAYTCQSYTAAGSCKDTTGTIHCASHGSITAGAPVDTYATKTSDGAELEACSDQGSGNQRGRAVVQVSTNSSHPGARVILDTDAGQPFPPGWIIVQASNNHPGVWCNDHGAPAYASDGYARSWNNPGDHGGTTDPQYCVPTLPVP